MIRIALAQINPTVGDLEGNKSLIEDFLLRARNNSADMVVFPEMAVCGYPPEDLLYKDHFIKANIKALKDIAKKISNVIAVIGFVDQDKKGNLYNAAAVIEGGKIKSVYQKQYLPNYGVFDEKRYFKEGKTQGIFRLRGITFAVSICEDIWEDVCQLQAKKGARLIINISSSPYDMEKLKERQLLIKKRALETKAHIVYCNIVGGQDELVFDGSSMVVDPKGNILAVAKEFEEDLLLVDIPLGKVVQKKSLLPKHIYKPSERISRVFKALVLGTRDYARKNDFKKAILGLSGGVDSALVAAIAVEALGKENVIAVTMPSRFSSEGTQSDAKALAASLGISLKEIPIEGIFGAYLRTLEAEFKGEEPNIAEENIQARIRGNILMAISNKFGWLVLTTGNKSEMAVGYCTLYGDMSGGFSVIKDVPKILVYELCSFINETKGNIIPESIIKRPPTAELKENQKDQDALPPYSKLDKILTAYVQEHQSLSNISKANDLEISTNIINLIDRNEYKRRQAPPGIKITPRAFGKDWRLPITNKYKELKQR